MTISRTVFVPLAAAALLAAGNAAADEAEAANKARVMEALNATIVAREPSTVPEFFGPDYINHNPLAPDSVEGLQGMIGALGPDFSAEYVRLLADGDLVATHGRYVGFGPEPLVAFDIFRLEDGKIVEHWDNLQPEARPNPSGRTQLDGATEITDLDQTEANRALVLEFITKVLINHEDVDITAYISPETYLQHNPMVADGLDGLGVFLGGLQAQGISMNYREVHLTVAEGNFVLAASEGDFGGAQKAFYDLFRLENGRIVEHWDVISDMPGTDAPHNESGKF